MRNKELKNTNGNINHVVPVLFENYDCVETFVVYIILYIMEAAMELILQE